MSKKKHGMPASHGNEVNVTPLIDVVMCLIIFFMLVAKIGVNSGADESIRIPESYLGGKIEDMGNAIVLNVHKPAGAQNSAIGASYAQITVANDKGELREMPLTEVDASGKATAVKPLKMLLTALQAKNKSYKVIIRGDADMQYQFLEPVLTTCAEAGATNVNFNTKAVQKEVAVGEAK